MYCVSLWPALRVGGPLSSVTGDGELGAAYLGHTQHTFIREHRVSLQIV